MNETSVYDVRALYAEEISQQYSPEQAKQILSETDSALFRLLEELGFKRSDFGKKINNADAEAAKKFMETVPIHQLQIDGREALQKAFERLQTSQASRKTYTARLDKFLQFTEQQSSYFSTRQLEIQNQCRPSRRLSGRRHFSDLPLTSRQGQYAKYRLMAEETSASLKQELNDLDQFLVAPNFPGRVCSAVRRTTADTYMKDIRLMLGYFYRQEGVPLEKLCLQNLFPVVTADELDELSYKQQQQLWREQKLYLERWIFRYFEFIRVQNSSVSPRTQLGKLVALERMAHFLYMEQVNRRSDYDTIPIFIILKDLISARVKTIRKWQKTRTYVANQERKWPDVVEGETALTTLRREVVEPLRLECRPRRNDGTFREPFVIAISHQHYLKWALLTDLPPRRQQAYRTTKVALSCPVECPKYVPKDSYYFPLPPPEEREKNHDGTIADNYLYKTYFYKNKSYPEGIWILELCSYKTDDTYGVYSMMIPNRQFVDGTTFYEHLDHYLCGWWMSQGYKNQQLYDWWDAQLRGKTGRWITKGRMEFEPQDICEAPNRHQSSVWRWGYLFPVPNTGGAANGCSFGGSFERTSYQILGKRITPHMVRYMWATWAVQVGLTDQEMRSLAYAMGHSVETLRQMYERCTQEEKLRPIYEAIDLHLFQQFEEQPKQDISKPNHLTIVETLRKLTPQEREQILRLAQGT